MTLSLSLPKPSSSTCPAATSTGAYADPSATSTPVGTTPDDAWGSPGHAETLPVHAETLPGHAETLPDPVEDFPGHVETLPDPAVTSPDHVWVSLDPAGASPYGAGPAPDLAWAASEGGPGNAAPAGTPLLVTCTMVTPLVLSETSATTVLSFEIKIETPNLAATACPSGSFPDRGLDRPFAVHELSAAGLGRMTGPAVESLPAGEGDPPDSDGGPPPRPWKPPRGGGSGPASAAPPPAGGMSVPKAQPEEDGPAPGTRRSRAKPKPRTMPKASGKSRDRGKSSRSAPRANGSQASSGGSAGDRRMAAAPRNCRSAPARARPVEISEIAEPCRDATPSGTGPVLLTSGLNLPAGGAAATDRVVAIERPDTSGRDGGKPFVEPRLLKRSQVAELVTGFRAEHSISRKLLGEKAGLSDNSVRNVEMSRPCLPSTIDSLLWAIGYPAFSIEKDLLPQRQRKPLY
ncbi:MAG: hypothetical protein LBT40_02935 [Deltaproteobacteria bacterium]|jgi:hypothetical protein|nr:hypothetical protein [Deltaproteobacteria bacterium]